MSGRPTPTGQVTFYDGTTMLGQSSLSGGTVSFASSSLSIGSHTITATYGGDSNTNANSATAGSITVTALAPAFTVTASPSTLTIAQGQSGTATLTVTANAAFNGAVSFRCGALPANASCTFSPSSLAITAGKTGSVSLVVNTSAQPSTSARRSGLSATRSGHLRGRPAARGLCSHTAAQALDDHGPRFCPRLRCRQPLWMRQWTHGAIDARGAHWILDGHNLRGRFQRLYKPDGQFHARHQLVDS